MTKIFNCLEGIRPRVGLRSVTFFLLLSVLSVWLIGVPGSVSAQVPVQIIDIPDPNLRAAIAEALGKAPGEAITRAEMETLVTLHAFSREITDLRGIEFAINLTHLNLWGNTISDISPLSSLINLIELDLENNNISDISAVAGLTNLKRLALWRNTISDISAVAGLTNLKGLYLGVNKISEIAALAGLTNLEYLWLGGNSISDISPLASLANLRRMQLSNNTISDISPLASLINLTYLEFRGNSISDISPLASLTNLTSLNLDDNSISDISPLSSLTTLKTLRLWRNSISDISPLSSLINLTYLNLGANTISDIFSLITLTNLTHLHVHSNNISDIETLEWLMAQGTVVYFSGNPAFETPGPKIEDRWGWLIVPATNVNSGSQAAGSGRDFLSEVSDGTVTETDVAVNGASVGTQVGHYVWTSAPLNATDRDNLNTIVWDYNLGTDIRYPVAYGVVSIQSETLQQTRVYIGGGPVKVWFNGALVHRDTTTHFVNNYQTAVPVQLVPGENLLFIAAYRSTPWDSWGAFFGFQDGTVYTVGAPGPGPLDVNGDGKVDVLDLVQVALFYGKRGNNLPEDVNADGVINVADLVAVANGVDAADDLSFTVEQGLLLALAEAAALEAIAEAPIGFGRHQHALSLRRTYDNVADALTDARALARRDVRIGKWLPLLEGLLQALTELRAIPEATALLPNYPNPFNPETWIPYHLAKAANVTLTIYDVRGSVVRELRLGHQPAGVYESRGRAAYWDGGNQLGEPVASGLYFYTLTTGGFTATRKMLIAK